MTKEQFAAATVIQDRIDEMEANIKVIRECNCITRIDFDTNSGHQFINVDDAEGKGLRAVITQFYRDRLAALMEEFEEL